MNTKVPFPQYMRLNYEPCPLPSQLQASGTYHSGVPEDIPCVPGHPSIPLTKQTVADFLRDELSTPVLDEISPYLPFVARRQADHIDALSMQRLKGRKVTVMEKPALHLVWFYDVVFVKPIPEYLLNWDFWNGWVAHCEERCPAGLLERSEKWYPLAAACGFLRSFSYLIRHHSDFRIAAETGLIPDGIEWPLFSRFIAQFRKIDDRNVSSRYHYGQLRLTRLNWAVRVLQPRTAKGIWNYQGMHWQTGQYVQQLLGPLMFGFASAATILSAIQVVVSIPEGRVMSTNAWNIFTKASWGFCVITICFVIGLWVALIFGIFCVLFAQFVFSVRRM